MNTSVANLDKNFSREERKLNGIVYTPSTLANYVANKVISYFLQDVMSVNNKKAHKLSRSINPNDWRMLDPACGGGELLAAVWSSILNILPSYFNEKDVFKIVNPSKILCGIDIDSKAVKYAKSRIMGLAVNQNNKKQINNFLTTNSLFPFNNQISSKGWNKILRNFDATEGFDIVIANPPWGANVDLYKNNLSRGEFLLYQGQFDTSDLFIELALLIVKNGGYFAFIIPDSLFSHERTNLRELLLKQTEIRFIGRFGEKIFDKINRACAVIICKKTQNISKRETECLRLHPEIRKKILQGSMSFKDAEDILCHKIPQDRFNNNQDYMFDIDLKIEEEGTLNHFKKLRSSFNDYLQSSRGVELSKYGKIYKCISCKLWLPLPNNINSKCSHCGNLLTINPKDIVTIVSKSKLDSYEPLIAGENISRYFIQDYLWIKVGVPGIKYKDRLIYSSPKILIRKTGVGISASIDYSCAYTNQVVYILQLRQEIRNPMPIEFFLCILNSRAMYYYLVKTHGETEWRSHPYITQKQILNFPLPDLKYLQNNKKKIVNSIVQIIKPYTKKNIVPPKEVDAKLEYMVAQLYNLKKKDYEIIYSTLDDVEELIPIRALKKISIDEIFSH